MAQTTAPTIVLANGVTIPGLGLGTAGWDDDLTSTVVERAIGLGYRLIDTAEHYRNEVGVGQGIKASGIDRNELFVTSKFNARWHGYDEVQEAFAESSARLGLDYIDLFLIHWPMPAKDRYVDAFRGMIKLLEDGRIRALGVSNFKPAHIDRVVRETGVAPHLNQIQVNPYVGRKSERDYHSAHRIVTEGYSPLVGRGSGDLVKEPLLTDIAHRHRRTPGQIVLRWHVQQSVIPIPKSSSPDHLAANLDVFSFELNEEDMAAVSALDRNGVGANDSDRSGH